MPGGASIDPVQANTALALGDLGYLPKQIADKIGLSASSVFDIINGHSRWGKVAEKPVFQALRFEQQKILEASNRAASALCLSRAVDEDKLNKASTYQLAIASKIFLESSRLLAGESTQNVSVQAKIDITALDSLASALSQCLIESNSDNK